MANASVAETSGQEWVGAVIDVAVTVGDGDDEFQPQTIVWLDAASGAVVGTELCRPGELEAHAAASLLAATRAPKEGAPRIPGRVRVETSELADALRGRIGEIEVVVGPVPELAPVAASLRDFLEGDREELTLLGDDMAPEVVERFFTAAARLHRLAPWKRVPTDCFFAVRQSSRR